MDTIAYQSLVAQRVAAAMAERGTSELAVSGATGIPRTTLRRKLESIPGSPFTVVDCYAIAEFLGIPVDSLLSARAA